MTKTYYVKYPDDYRIFEIWIPEGEEDDTDFVLVDGYLTPEGEWVTDETEVSLPGCDWFGDYDSAVQKWLDEWAFEN